MGSLLDIVSCMAPAISSSRPHGKGQPCCRTNSQLAKRTKGKLQLPLVLVPVISSISTHVYYSSSVTEARCAHTTSDTIRPFLGTFGGYQRTVCDCVIFLREWSWKLHGSHLREVVPDEQAGLFRPRVREMSYIYNAREEFTACLFLGLLGPRQDRSHNYTPTSAFFI